MTAITISAPVGPRRATPARPLAAASRRQKARRDAQPASRSSLRLTRRGRLVITGLLAAVAVAVSLFVGGQSLAGTAKHPVSVQYVTVVPGETLWSIAGEVAPQADRRDTVAQIMELNALASAELQAGQRIAVPAS